MLRRAGNVALSIQIATSSQIFKHLRLLLWLMTGLGLWLERRGSGSRSGLQPPPPAHCPRYEEGADARNDDTAQKPQHCRSCRGTTSSCLQQHWHLFIDFLIFLQEAASKRMRVAV